MAIKRTQGMVTPFALPLQISDYQNDFVIHDARWQRVAAFKRNSPGAREKAEFLVKAVNAYAKATEQPAESPPAQP